MASSATLSETNGNEMETDNSKNISTSILCDRDILLINAIKSEMGVLISDLNKKVDDMNLLIRTSTTEHSSRLNYIENDQANLREEVTHLRRINERLIVELREKNLIFIGVADSENEHTNKLMEDIANIILQTTGISIKIDFAFRIGTYQTSATRPVKVKFLTLTDRNNVYEKRSSVSSNIVIKEDKPFTMRRDQALLWNKKDELQKQGLSSTINYKKRQLETTDGDTFIVENGEILQMNNDASLNTPNNSQAGQGSKQIRKRLKHTHQPNPNFLGLKNLRTLGNDQPYASRRFSQTSHATMSSSLNPGRSSN